MTEPTPDPAVAAALAALLPPDDTRPYVYFGATALAAEFARLIPGHPAAQSGRTAIEWAAAARPELRSRGLALWPKRHGSTHFKRVRLERRTDAA